MSILEEMTCVNCRIIFHGKRPPAGTSWVPLCSDSCGQEWMIKHPTRYPKITEHRRITEEEYRREAGKLLGEI